MQYQLSCTLAGRSQKPLNGQMAAWGGICKQQGGIAQCHGRNVQFDSSKLPGFRNIGNMGQQHFQSRQACRRVPQWLDFRHYGGEIEFVHSALPARRRYSSLLADSVLALALRASSRSTDFIMTDAAVCALVVLMTR